MLFQPDFITPDSKLLVCFSTSDNSFSPIALIKRKNNCSYCNTIFFSMFYFLFTSIFILWDSLLIIGITLVYTTLVHKYRCYLKLFIGSRHSLLRCSLQISCCVTGSFPTPGYTTKHGPLPTELHGQLTDQCNVLSTCKWLHCCVILYGTLDTECPEINRAHSIDPGASIRSYSLSTITNGCTVFIHRVTSGCLYCY